MDKVSSSLPSVLFDSPEMKEMLEAANDVLSWHNDIWSVKKVFEISDTQLNRWRRVASYGIP